jgi:hypothetical protein
MKKTKMPRSNGVPTSMPGVSMPGRTSKPITGPSLGKGSGNPHKATVAKSMGKNGGAIC